MEFRELFPSIVGFGPIRRGEFSMEMMMFTLRGVEHDGDSAALTTHVEMGLLTGDSNF